MARFDFSPEPAEDTPDFDQEFRNAISHVDDELKELEGLLRAIKVSESNIIASLEEIEQIRGSDQEVRQRLKKVFDSIFDKLKEIHHNVCKIELSDHFFQSVLQRDDIPQSVKREFSKLYVKWAKNNLRTKGVLNSLKKPCGRLKNAIKAEIKSEIRVTGEFDRIKSKLNDIRSIVARLE